MRRHGKPVIPSELDGSLPTQNLVWHLDASDGVATSGTDVTSWSDLVGSNDLDVVVGTPQLVAGGAPGGNDYVEFNGVDQALRRGSFSGLPTGNTPRTLATVVRYNTAGASGAAGVAYGLSGTNREVFGCCIRANGNFVLQLWGPDDYDSGVNGLGFWALQITGLYDDVEIGQRANFLVNIERDLSLTPNTNPAGVIEVGREIDGTPFAEVDIAQVLLYSPNLTNPQIAQLYSYVSNRYGFSFV